MAVVLVRRKHAAAFAVAAFVGYCCTLSQQWQHFQLAVPVERVLDADVANTAGTAITQGSRGFHPTPPNAPVDASPMATRGAATT